MEKKFGDFIKQSRENKNISVNELAYLVGMSSVQIRNIESNKYKPNIIKLSDFAKALDCDFDFLYSFYN